MHSSQEHRATSADGRARPRAATAVLDHVRPLALSSASPSSLVVVHGLVTVHRVAAWRECQS